MVNRAARVLLLAEPERSAFVPAPRAYRGNMCGISLRGLPAVPGGASDPALVLSWFYDRYSAEHRRDIRAAWRDRGLVDVLLSWPDSRAAGASPDAFGAICRELVAEGFIPCVMLCSKDFDPPDVPEIERRMSAVLPVISGVAGRICVGWELSLWLQPVQVQQLTDWLAPQVIPWGGKLYVHFQAEYGSFQKDGGIFADYWNANIGKLTGLLYQGDASWTPEWLQVKLADILDRFAGQFFCSPDSGFGHPFDCIALELTATRAYNDGLPEPEQDVYAAAAVGTTPVMGPLGLVRVQGSGNGVA